MDNPLRDYIYDLGKKEEPEYVWEWFYRYLASGDELFYDNEPKELLQNYHALITMGRELLKSKYGSGEYSTFIRDGNTPDWTYYFVGDTHGAYQDVYLMVNYFIQVLQVNSHVKIVWIGDFVDRNPHDLQNLALIMSFWMMFRDNVFLLRGNHEAGDVCSRYGFSNNLYESAGSSKKDFNPVWEDVTDFFSKLPLGFYCRVGDKNVFACHGGIPFDVDDYKPLKLSEIEGTLNCFQKETFDMDPISQAMLWSDPDPYMLDEEGDVAPTPRTGRPRFSEHAFHQFMKINNLDVLIRGHQKWKTGYKLLFDNNLVSLFSTSTYDSRKIGEAKFFRLRPDMRIENFGDEQLNLGEGILNIDQKFLDTQFNKYYAPE